MSHTDKIVKAGYLTKQGGPLQTWKRRWFILRGNTLCYYKDESVMNKILDYRNLWIVLIYRLYKIGHPSSLKIIPNISHVLSPLSPSGILQRGSLRSGRSGRICSQEGYQQGLLQQTPLVCIGSHRYVSVYVPPLEYLLRYTIWNSPSWLG